MKVNDHLRGRIVLDGKKEKGERRGEREGEREGGVREREMRRV